MPKTYCRRTSISCTATLGDKLRALDFVEIVMKFVTMLDEIIVLGFNGELDLAKKGVFESDIN